MAAFDLRMPNGQLVEYYLPLKEIDAAETKGPNHELFKKWRNVSEEERFSRIDEYNADVAESRQRYNEAWKRALQRLGVDDERAAAASWIRLSSSLGSMTGTKLSRKSKGSYEPGLQAPPSRIAPATPRSDASTITRSPERSLETTGAIEPILPPRPKTGKEGRPRRSAAEIAARVQERLAEEEGEVVTQREEKRAERKAESEERIGGIKERREALKAKLREIADKKKDLRHGGPDVDVEEISTMVQYVQTYIEEGIVKFKDAAAAFSEDLGIGRDRCDGRLSWRGTSCARTIPISMRPSACSHCPRDQQRRSERRSRKG